MKTGKFFDVTALTPYLSAATGERARNGTHLERCRGRRVNVGGPLGGLEAMALFSLQSRGSQVRYFDLDAAATARTWLEAE